MPARFSLFLTVALALGACNGNGAGSPPSGAPAEAVPPLNSTAAWMARDAKTHDLLYVSNRKDGSVYVYSYPQNKLEGWLLNAQATGLCSDGNGDVFIPEGNEILEYAHGDTRPIAVLRNSVGGVSQFCAIDPATGNLAVSGGTSRKYGVAIYTNAQGNPRIYKDFNGAYWSCTYDKEGNLFVEAAAGGLDGTVSLLELPKGGTRIKPIAWSRTRAPRLGSIQWDGKYLAAERPSRRFRSGDDLPVQRERKASHVREPDCAQGRRQTPAILDSRRANRHTQPRVERLRHPWRHVLRLPAMAHTAINDSREPQAAIVSPARHRKVAVVTYHYNNLRTGWDDKESLLTDESVTGGSFGLLHTVTLDDQVDTQPLIVPDETTTRGASPGKHDVVYVATENDTVYAVDASSGTVLFQQSLGSPVPTPLGCNNNGPNVGIDGTPVIDKQANTMYVIAYTLQGSTPTYYIHELSLANLSGRRGAGPGLRFPHLDTIFRLHVQRNIPATAAGTARSERDHLRRVR